MKKKRKTRRSAVMAATTTAKDWGFGPVSGKGGKSINSEISERTFHRELKEAEKK